MQCIICSNAFVTRVISQWLLNVLMPVKQFWMCSLNTDGMSVDMCMTCIWLCHLLQLLMVRLSDEPTHIYKCPLNTSHVWPLPQNCSGYFMSQFFFSDVWLLHVLMQPGSNLGGVIERHMSSSATSPALAAQCIWNVNKYQSGGSCVTNLK